MGVGASAADRLRLRQVSAEKKAELRNAAIDKLAPGEALSGTYLYGDGEDVQMNGYQFLAFDKRGKGLTGCEFACHVKSYAKYGDSLETLARENNVTLRIDVAKSGIIKVAELANAAAATDSYVRMGLHVFSTALAKQLDPNADLNAIKNKLANAQSVGLGSAAVASNSFRNTLSRWHTCWNIGANTFFDANVPSFANYLGDWRGKAASNQTGDRVPTQVVLLVTDGLKSQNCAASSDPTGKQAVYPFPPADCAKLKATGALVAVVYTEYVNSPLPTYNGHAKHAVEESSTYVYTDPTKSPGIEKNLRACASPGLFAKGKEPDEIENAFKTVFENIKITPFLAR
jgi:hypothetical protein